MPRTRRQSPAAALRRAALLLAWVAAGNASAQESREQAAHVHGTIGITLAVVAGALELELSAPGMDLVGFEHAPRDEQQAESIAKTTATLERSGDWLAFEPAGSCTVASADAHTHGFKAAEADGGDHHDDASPAHNDAAGSPDHDHDAGAGHDDQHEHEHEHEHDHDGGHGEFHLQLTGTCSATPQALRIDLGARFPGIERIRVDVITDSVQDRVELRAGQTRVPLAR